MPDGAADAPAVDAARVSCPPPHDAALFCSEFERALESEWEVASTGSATLERSTTRSHRGGGALRAASDGASSYAVVSADFAPLRSGVLFVRSYVYVEAGLDSEIMNILFVGDRARTEPFAGVDVNLDDGVLQLFSPRATPTRQAGTLAIPRGRWFCLRLQLAIDDVEGSLELFVDDQLVLSSGRFDTLPAAGVNVLRAGIDWSSQQTSRFEIYFDDLVVDTRALDCAS